MTNQADKKWLQLVLWAGFVGLIFYIGAISSQFKPTPDSCEYLGLAKSLANGQGYQFNDRSGSRYPPVLPLFLAGLMLISKDTGSALSVVVIAKIAQVALALLTAVGGWRLARYYLDKRFSALVGLLIWANLFIFQHCQFILSDVLYCCLSVWGLVLLQDKITQKRFFAALIFVSPACLTRTLGLLFVPAVLAGIIFCRPPMLEGKRRWVWAFMAPAVCSTPTIFWKFLGAGAEGGGYLTKWIAESGQNNLPMAMLTCFKTMAPLVAANSAQTLLNIELSGLPFYFTAIVFAIWISGWWQNFHKKRGVVEWYVLFYLGLMSVWFADQGPRFYLPLLPMMLIYAITGLKRLSQLSRQQSKSRILVQTALIIGLAILTLPLAIRLPGISLSALIMALVRDGYVYCLLAASILAFILLGKAGFLRRFSAWQVTSVGLILIYLAIAWAYGASYLVLERRLITSREPMLAGYQSYWQMGEWLKNLELTEQPVLAAQASIVHLASEQTIREPQRDDRQTWQNLINGDYTRVLCLYYLLSDQKPADGNNDQINRLIQEHPESFILQNKQGENPEFRLYYFVPPEAR